MGLTMLSCSGNRWANVLRLIVASLALRWGCCERALAVGRDYTIDMTQSSIAVSGTVYSVDLNQTKPIVQQGPGGLTTTYTGTIKTDRAAGNVMFLSGSTMDANTSGSWKPLSDATDGSAPADYGGKSSFTYLVVLTDNVYFAGRNLVADVTSGTLDVNGSNQFNMSTMNLLFTSGTISYRDDFALAVGSNTLVGLGGALTGSGTLGSLSEGGRVYETLTLPMNASFVLSNASATITLDLTGQIVAKYLIPSTNGDYNQNGIVDTADYVVWRNSQGQTGLGLAADGNGDNQITSADFDVWRSKFGQAATGIGVGEGLSSASAVPEPSALLLLVVVVVFVHGSYRQRV